MAAAEVSTVSVGKKKKTITPEKKNCRWLRTNNVTDIQQSSCVPLFGTSFLENKTKTKKKKEEYKRLWVNETKKTGKWK